MMVYELLIQPFVEHDFMRRSLAACFALSIGCGPVGVFLMLRRMSLMGDAMSHAILPGVAVAFIFFGTALWPMTIGGFVAGLAVALLAGLVSRATELKEDASVAALYLISLAGGVMLITMRGESDELLHILFGDVFAMQDDSLLMVAAITTLTLLALAAIYRPLVMECFDPVFLRTMGNAGTVAYMVFLALVALNLVAGFRAMGTLMTLGLMILPAASASFWTRRIDRMIGLAVGLAFASGLCGLLVSHHLQVPSGSAMVLSAGAVYIVSLLAGRHRSLYARKRKHRHLKA